MWSQPNKWFSVELARLLHSSFINISDDSLLMLTNMEVVISEGYDSKSSNYSTLAEPNTLSRSLPELVVDLGVQVRLNHGVEL